MAGGEGGDEGEGYRVVEAEVGLDQPRVVRVVVTHRAWLGLGLGPGLGSGSGSVAVSGSQGQGQG